MCQNYFMKKFSILLILFLRLGYATPFVNAQQVYFDTVQVYFDIGKTHFLSATTQTLDSLLQNLKQTQDKILIYGFADYLGSENPNQTLSDQRAYKVQKYLLQKGLSPTQIIQTTGVGQVDIKGREAHGNQDFRKVSIFIRRKGKLKITSKKDLKMQSLIDKIEVGKTFTLKNINFIVNSSRYTNESEPIVEELLQIMIQNPSLKIKLEGHICCIDTKDEDAFDVVYHDFHLSKNRARRIYFYLTKHGIDKSRVSFEGFGKSRPLVNPEITEEDKEKNRRVEVRIMEK